MLAAAAQPQPANRRGRESTVAAGGSRPQQQDTAAHISSRTQQPRTAHDEEDGPQQLEDARVQHVAAVRLGEHLGDTMARRRRDGGGVMVMMIMQW